MPRPSSRANRRPTPENVTTEYGAWLLEDFPRFCKETRLIFPWYDQPILEMCAEMGFAAFDETRKTQEKKLYLAPRGSWKALDLDTEVATPLGFTKIRDIGEGQTIYDSEGQPTRVLGVSPVYHGRPCYEVEFSSGEKVVCDEGHVWVTSSRRDRDNRKGQPCYSAKTTGEIRDTLMCRKEKNHRVATVPAVRGVERSLLVPPYTLGIWLGDGTTHNSNITCADPEIAEYIRAEGVPMLHRPTKSDPYRYVLNGGLGHNEPRKMQSSVQAKLRSLGVLRNKHIPREYLAASVPQRLALLQGLLDSDGHAPFRQSRAVFYNGNPKLCEDVRTLACSLGFKPRRIGKYKSNLGGRECAPSYQFDFSCYSDDEHIPFRLSRKAARLKPRPARTFKHRQIVAVRSVESRPVKCLMVDSPTRQFAITRGFIPTHNTSLVIARIIFLLLKYPQIRLLLYRATRETSQQMLREVKGHLMSNTVIAEHFGNLWEGSPKWDEDAIIISTRKIAPGDRDPSVMTIGVDGQTAGFHPDGVFMDDVVTEQNCDSPQLMEKAWRMMQSVYGLLQPWGWTLVTGTRWSNIDCYQKIIDINKACDEAEVPRAFEEYIRTVYITNPETGEQELFFPARLSQEFIDSQRNNPALEARYFESWYFNRMVDPKAKPFKMGDCHFFDCDYYSYPYRYIKLTGAEFAGEEIEVFTVMVVDPALTANPSSCAYGLSVCGFDANKNFMMLESKELIDLPSKADATIFEMLDTYIPDLLIIESGGGDAALMTRIGGYIERKQLKTRVVSFAALQDMPRGKRSKEQRINAMEPWVTQGYMWIRRGFCNELIRQMDLYPSLVRNDVIDSWATLGWSRKFIPDAKEFTKRKSEEGLEPDPYAITYFDKVLGKEVTVGWDAFHANPLPSTAGPEKVSKGCWTGRHLSAR